MGTRDEYAETIKDGASSIGTRLAMSSLVLKFPILANPFLHLVAEHFVGDLLDGLIKRSEYGVFFRYIDLRTTAQGRAFYDAVKARQTTLNSNATEKEKQDAEDDQLRKFSQFVVLHS